MRLDLDERDTNREREGEREEKGALRLSVGVFALWVLCVQPRFSCRSSYTECVIEREGKGKGGGGRKGERTSLSLCGPKFLDSMRSRPQRVKEGEERGGQEGKEEGGERWSS